jgi:hypothetical protein
VLRHRLNQGGNREANGSSWSACVRISPPRTTWLDAPRKDSPSERSCAASSATPLERSSGRCLEGMSRPATPQLRLLLDNKRSLTGSAERPGAAGLVSAVWPSRLAKRRRQLMESYQLARRTREAGGAEPPAGEH